MNEEKQSADKIYNVGTVNNMYVENLVLQQTEPTSQPALLPEKKRYITDTPKTRYLLDDYEDEDEFETCPTRFCILSLYFFTLSYNQEYYALLESAENWSVPYTLSQLEWKDIRKVKEIKNMYSESLPGLTETLFVLESALFCNLGIESKKIEKGREYIESQDGKITYIREFFVKEINPAGVINLVDPECLKMHRFVPFTILDQLPKIDGFISFLDRPIPDNVADVLLYERRRLIKNAITVSREDLVCQLEGILFIITLMNNKKLISPTHMLSLIFDQAMLFGNIGRYCVDGANVIGYVPYKKYNFTDLLCRMYEGLSKIHPELTLCCTALYCKSEYGKVYSLSSLSASFRLPDQFLSHDLGSAQTWEYTNKQPGILFGWDIRDNERVIFAPKGARIFKPTDYKEENRMMNFIVWEKNTPELQHKERIGTWRISDEQ